MSSFSSSFDTDVSVLASSQEEFTTVDVLESQRTKRSWIFTNDLARRENQEGIPHIVCQVRGCRKVYVNRDYSTSNIRRHLKNQHGITESNADRHSSAAVSGPLDNFVAQSQPATEITRDTWRSLVSRFLVKSQSPFTLVELPEFRQLVATASSVRNGMITEPVSADTAKRDIAALYEEKKIEVMELLQQQVSLSFTLDLWTSEWGQDFFAITAHFIDDNWQQRELLIGFEHPEDRHTGEDLADIFLRVLEDFGVVHLLFTITSDNGSNIAKMAKVLEERSMQDGRFFFNKDHHHLPCLGHILNLAVQSALKDGLHAEPLADNEEEHGQSSNVVSKLRTGIKMIRRSTSKYRKFYIDSCKSLYHEVKQLNLDVKTRWNSTMVMVERALEVREAYNETCRYFSELSEFALSDEDVTYLQRVVVLFSMFSGMTKAVSSSRYPSINIVVFAYNVLLDQIEDFRDERNPPELSEAARRAQEKLQQFYAKTDQSPVYATATALDPRLKYAYWTEQNWEPEFIADAKCKVQSAWAEWKGPDHVEEDRSDDVRDVYRPKRRRVLDSLQAYVEAPLLIEAGPSNDDEDSCELLFWRTVGQVQYPQLAKMARKYFAIPATSTPCERFFSRAKHFIPAVRNRLQPEPLKQSILLNSWL